MPTSVAAGMVVLLGTCAFAAYASVRTLARQLGPRPGRTRVALAGAALGILALGCRLCVAEGMVSWAPYLDQWHAEISGVAVPLAHGTLGLGDLVAGNNEHRVVLTRAVALGVMVLDGSWDNRVLVAVNVALEALAVAWVGALAWGTLGWARGSIAAAAAFLPMLLVCDWETMVSSNQMQFVFMAFGSVVGLSLAHRHSLRSLGTWAVLALSVLMLGSMATGCLTALSAAATGLLVAFAGRRGFPRVAGCGAACAAIAAAGWLTRVEFTALYPMYAASVGGWVTAFLMYAAWPLPANLLGCAALWAPWGVLLAATLARRRLEPLAVFGLGLGFWALLQAGALAWARAGFVGLVGSRYTEFLGWGFVANAASAAVLLRGVGSSRAWRGAAWAVTLAWLAAVGGREVWCSAAVYDPYLQAFRAQTREHEERLGTFMRTGDAAAIESVRFPHIPYDSGEILTVLRDPGVQPLLPAPLRRDRVRDREASTVAREQDGPLNFLAIHLFGCGPGLVGAGIALGVGVVLLERRGTPALRRAPAAGPKETARAAVLPRQPGRSRA